MASFEDYLTGGRATGVDGAMTAASDDVFGLYYNPASISKIKEQQLGAYYGRLYGGLSDNSNIYRDFFGYVYPMEKQSLGLSYTGLALSGLYQEQVFGLSYGRDLSDQFSVGATLNYLRKSFGTDAVDAAAFDTVGNPTGGTDPVFANGGSASGLGVDLGAQYQMDHGITLGTMIRNLNEPNVSLQSGAADRAPRTWRFGVAKQWDNKNKMVTLDVTESRFTQEETEVHGGAERWWSNGFGARLGGGIGARDYRRVTAGFSYRMSWLQVDYGFMMPLTTVQDTFGTHQISLTFRFGKKSANLAPSVLAPVIVPPPAPPTEPVLTTTAPLPEKKTFILAGGAKGLILFDTDKWHVNQANAGELKEFLDYMKAHPMARAEIEGHTDNVASAEYNQRLSERRALSVMNYLVDTAGIEAWRLSAKGYGLTRPIADNSTSEGRHQNRRVVATITEQESDNLGIQR
jgi:OOP family OmpA-OmpF porin